MMLRWFAELWEVLETITGVVAAFFIGYLPTVALIFVSFAALGNRQWVWAVLAVTGLAIALGLAIWVTRLVGAGLYDRYPQFGPAPTRRAPSARRSEADQSRCDRWSTSAEDLPDAVAELDNRRDALPETVSEMVRRQTRPLALLVADRVRGVPLMLRPVLSLWWLGHFVAGALIGHFASQMAVGVLNNPGFGFVVVVPLGLQMALLFAVNLYLVMAVAVASRDRRPHEFVWRWRLVIDVLISAGIILWAG